MKITSVLTAVNNNPKYVRFIPFFIQQWKKLYPHINIKIVFIGSKLPDNLKEYEEYIDVFPEIPGISSVYTAQTIRILYPALMGDNEVTVITDMDMVPANKSYFNQEIQDNSFVVFRPLNCVGQGEIAICYNAAPTSVWKEVFGINTIDDVQTFLINKYKYSDGKHGGKGWNTDQILLYNAVTSWNGDICIVGDDTFRRLDFFHHIYDKSTFLKMLNSEAYSDAHLYADLCPWSDI